MKVSIRAGMKVVRGSDVHPLKWAFEDGSKLGFDGLELCMQAGSYQFSLAGSWTDEMKDGVTSMCQEYGMSIFSLSSDWAWSYASFFPELKGWLGRGSELILDDAKLARDLGAHTILVHFGTSKGSWDDCKAALMKVAEAGEETGVSLGYEANIWERLGFGGLDTLCKMVDEIGSPKFGVYLHNNHPRAGLPLEEEVAASGDRLLQAMHSSSLVSGRVEIDFEKAFAAMKQNFADGAYTFEVSWDEAAENKKVIDEMITKHW